ncbi:hypothetical protein TRIP_D450084 [uncultured Paludibacter sp.]|nr:hypothetical protein TRIP_D450084 [uncultured Paludibacter sp.]
MATSQNPLTGRMSGTVGNFVATTYRGQNVIRSKAFNPKDANSEAQQKHRSIFKLMSDEYTSLASIISFGFPNRPKNQSPYNAFMAANLPVAVDKSGETPVIDYSKMVLSKGSLPRVNVVSVETGETGITVNYQPRSAYPEASPDDVVTAVVKSTEGMLYSVSKPRGELETDSILLPLLNATTDNVIYIYLMVVSADKQKASQTSYVVM